MKAVRFCLSLLALWLLAGCATNKVDWPGRLGTYTFDQAIMDYGPPDRTSKLSDGSTVAEWLTRRGYAYVYPAFGYGFYPYGYPPFYPFPFETYRSPDYFLRLAFDSNNRLKAWKKFCR